jgi:hypothetical protein
MSHNYQNSSSPELLYGIFVVVIIILIVMSYNWYVLFSNDCINQCTSSGPYNNQQYQGGQPNQYGTFNAQQGGQPVAQPTANAATSVTSSPAGTTVQTTTSRFSGRGGGYTEKHLEGFVNSRGDAPSNNINTDDFLPDYNSNTEVPVPDWDPAKIALEQTVFDSHQEFISDAYINVQGPNNTNTVRDDDVGPVKQWGLRRVDYTGVFSGDDARVVSSEYPDQVAREEASIVL